MQLIRRESETTPMSEEENNKSGETAGSEPESESPESLEISENDSKASAPPEKSSSIMYGTRKLHPGAKSASAKSLDQIRGPYEDDDILEMDDVENVNRWFETCSTRPASQKAVNIPPRP